MDVEDVEYWKKEALRNRIDLEEYIESSKELEVALEQELLEAQDKNEQLLNECSSLKARLEGVSAKESGLDQVVAQLQAHKQKLEAEIVSCKNRIRTLEHKNSELESSLRIHQTSLEDAQSKADHALEQLIVVQGEKEEVEQKAEVDRERTRAKLVELKADLHKKEKQLESNSLNASALESSGAKHLEEIKLLTEDKSKMSEELGQLNKLMLEKEEQFRSLEAKLEASAEMESKITALEEELELSKCKLQMAQESRPQSPKFPAEQRDELFGEISRLGALVEEKEAEMHEKVSNFETEMSALETLKDEKQNQIATLQRRIAKVESEKRELLDKKHKQDMEMSMMNAQPKTDKALREAYKEQLIANSLLAAQIQKLRGNIVVFCRIKKNLEETLNQKIVVEALGREEIGFFDEKQATWKPFAFDRVFGPSSTQSDIARELSLYQLAESVVGGYKGCVMAYGQTSSGKTYTMDGTATDPGITFNTISRIFEVLDSIESCDKKLELAMLEIYNEHIRDLLADDPSMTGSNGPFTLEKLCWRTCESVSAVSAALDQGRSVRATAETDLNLRSSRSHLIQVVRCAEGGLLYLVDLAGSENVQKSNVHGSRLCEAKAINKSLSSLGDVMEALDNKSKHVPYRNSKLTMVLQPALNGRTIMILNVQNTQVSSKETHFTLKFGSRVRNIEIGPAKKHVLERNSKAVISELKQQLAKQESSLRRVEGEVASLKRQKSIAEEKVALEKANLERAQEAHKKAIAGLQIASNKELNGLKSKLSQLRSGDVSDGASKVSSSKIHELEQTIAAQKREIERLRSRMSRQSSSSDMSSIASNESRLSQSRGHGTPLKNIQRPPNAQDPKSGRPMKSAIPRPDSMIPRWQSKSEEKGSRRKRAASKTRDTMLKSAFR